MTIQKQTIKMPITRTPERLASIEPESSETDRNKVKMKCYFPNCGYEWDCESKTEKITCAGCCRKLDREKAIVRESN